MNDPKLIKSLAIAWPTLEKDYLYAVAILKQLGRYPEFPNVPNYLRLWAWVTTGQLLGEDVSQWEPMLTAETERLRKINQEYEAVREGFQTRIAALNKRRQELIATQKELEAALSKEIGH